MGEPAASVPDPASNRVARAEQHPLHDALVAERRGHRGEGTVYWSKSDRRWIARWPLGIVDGKRRSKRAKAKTEQAANAALERFRRAYGAGVSPAAGTLDAYLADWLIAHGRSIRPSTLRSYRGHVKHHIGPLLGGMRLVDIGPRDVRRLIAELERKRLSAGTIHLVIRTLSTALQAAVDDRALGDNATRGVRLPRIDRPAIKPLTIADRDRILEAVAGGWVERPVRVWLGSGLRRGEVIGLDQGDVQDGYVRVRVSKTNVRAVPVSDDAVAALREAIAAAPRIGPHEPVFFGNRAESRHERMPADSISHALPRILERAGLGHLTPHALRHGAATLMLTGGASMRAIAEQLGHRRPDTTARVYAHVVPDVQRAAVRLLERQAKG